jgi:hypothetical protein
MQLRANTSQQQQIIEKMMSSFISNFFRERNRIMLVQQSGKFNCFEQVLYESDYSERKFLCYQL